MRTALYLRVLTAQQKPDLQRDGLRSDAERMGLEVMTEYTDVAVSGRWAGRRARTAANSLNVLGLRPSPRAPILTPIAICSMVSEDCMRTLGASVLIDPQSGDATSPVVRVRVLYRTDFDPAEYDRRLATFAHYLVKDGKGGDTPRRALWPRRRRCARLSRPRLAQSP
jgi:Resolvase, N terminal domain